MKRKRYTEEQIVAILKESSTGVSAAELSRKYGMSEPSFYKWKSKYAGMDVSDLRKMKTSEEENPLLDTHCSGASIGHSVAEGDHVQDTVAVARLTFVHYAV